MALSLCLQTLALTCDHAGAKGHVLDAIRNDPACAAEAKGILDRAWIEREEQVRLASAAICQQHEQAIEAAGKEVDRLNQLVGDQGEALKAADQQRANLEKELAVTAALVAELQDPEVFALISRKRADRLTADQVAAKRAEIARLQAELGEVPSV